MRVSVIVAKKGETPPDMRCAVTGKAVQSGATAVALDDNYWCYVNPRRVLTNERRAELLASVRMPERAERLRKVEGEK